MQRVRRCERPVELRIERTASRQPQHVRERPQPRLPGPGDGGRLPPGLSAATAHRLNLRAKPDAADNGQMRVVAHAPRSRCSSSPPGSTRAARRTRTGSRSWPAQSPCATSTSAAPVSGRGSSRSLRTPAGSTSTSTAARPTRRASRPRRAAAWSASGAASRARSRVCSPAAAIGARWTRSAASSRSRTSRGTFAGSSTRRGRSATPCRRRSSSPGASASRLATPRAIALRVAADDSRAPAGEYHSVQCRPGGAYDLRPDTAAWPSG